MDAVSTSALFKGLPPEACEELARNMPRREVPAGEVLFERGDLGEEMFFVVEGEVAVLLVPEEPPVALVGKGECFGEMTLLSREPRMASMRAQTDTSLLVLSRPLLVAAMKQHPSLKANIRTVMEDRLLSNKKAACSLFDNLPEVARTELANRMTPRKAKAKEVLIAKGRASDQMFFVVHGTAEVLLEVGGKCVATITRGGCFGEMALLNEDPPMAFVQAKTDMSLLTLSRSQLAESTKLHPGLELSVREVIDDRSLSNMVGAPLTFTFDFGSFLDPASGPDSPSGPRVTGGISISKDKKQLPSLSPTAAKREENLAQGLSFEPPPAEPPPTGATEEGSDDEPAASDGTPADVSMSAAPQDLLRLNAVSDLAQVLDGIELMHMLDQFHAAGYRDSDDVLNADADEIEDHLSFLTRAEKVRLACAVDEANGDEEIRTTERALASGSGELAELLGVFGLAAYESNFRAAGYDDACDVLSMELDAIVAMSCLQWSQKRDLAKDIDLTNEDEDLPTLLALDNRCAHGVCR